MVYYCMMIIVEANSYSSRSVKMNSSSSSPTLIVLFFVALASFNGEAFNINYQSSSKHQSSLVEQHTNAKTESIINQRKIRKRNLRAEEVMTDDRFNEVFDFTVTRLPTVSPTSSPSVSAQPSLSLSPTASPSVSLNPSASPSISMAPSTTPSMAPSYSPSSEPSDQPSLAPSDSPSLSHPPSSANLISLNTDVKENNDTNGKTILWTCISVVSTIMLSVAYYLHRRRASTSPMPKLFTSLSNDDTIQEIPSGSTDSLTINADEKTDPPPPTIFLPCIPNNTSLPCTEVGSFSVGTSPRDNLTDEINHYPRLESPCSVFTRTRTKESVQPPQYVPDTPMNNITPLGRPCRSDVREIFAPPGKLGFLLKQTPDGCMVQSIKTDSPMLDIMFESDLILSVNNMDVSNINVRQLTHWIAENVNIYKKFTVINKGDPNNQSLSCLQTHAEQGNANNIRDNENPRSKTVPSRRGLSPSSRMACLPDPNVKRFVIAPPGKLGVMFKQSFHGCLVHSVTPESTMRGKLFEGDRILTLNDKNVSDLTARNLTQLIAENINIPKRLTVINKRDPMA